MYEPLLFISSAGCSILISVHWDEGTSFQLYEIRDFDFGSVIVGYRSVSGNQPVPKRAAAVVKGF